MTCPYCNKNIEKPVPERFMAWPLCGYKSARVGSEPDGYLVIDGSLPNLIDKFQELLRSGPEDSILIDRRVGQMPIAGTERRRWKILPF